MTKGLVNAARLLLALCIPILIVVFAVRLLTTKQYVSVEYSKKSFPPDAYGFTPAQRLKFAATNIRYVREATPSDALANETLDGKGLYIPRELSHMVDVRNVFGFVRRLGVAALVLAFLLGVYLWNRGLRALFGAIEAGGWLTMSLMALLGILAVVAWQNWFTVFHLFFFQPGSWLFEYSDTLIRLFPEKFWFDTAVTLVEVSFMIGALVAMAGRYGKSRAVSVPARG